MCKVPQGTQRLARPKLYPLGAYSKSKMVACHINIKCYHYFLKIKLLKQFIIWNSEC